ncbi:MAG: FCD domain-containing protein [Pseudomonadota bacterium]
MKHEAELALVRSFLLGAGPVEGDRLPTERALVERLGVSRNVVRDALAVLEAEGRIVRKVGSGTYFASADGAQAVPDVSPKQIVEARFAFEPNLAGIAAMNCTKHDLELLAERARDYHRADSFGAFELADEAFHAAIAAATHNPVLVSAYQAFSAAHAAAEWGSLRQRFLTAERRVASRREHDKILAALRSRDAAAAVGAVREHLHYIASAILQQ